MGYLGGSVVTNLPASVGDAGDWSSIPGSGRSPEEEVSTHSSMLTWKIPWTEELAGYHPWGHRVKHD